MFSNLSRAPTVGYQPLSGMADEDQKDDDRAVPTEERIDNTGEHDDQGRGVVADTPEDADDERVVLTEEDVYASHKYAFHDSH